MFEENTRSFKGGSELKKVIFLLFTGLLMIASSGLAACGSTPSTGTTGGTATPTPTSGGSSSGISWNDVPSYSGANQIQKGNWSIPPAQGEWVKLEWRYYETGDDVSKVADFYRSAMSDNGWEETAWTEIQNFYWGYFTKNDEQDGAMFWAGTEEGSTKFALMRATK